MRKDIHPNYRKVIFFDTSRNSGFLTRSTVETIETMSWKEGKVYPVYKVEVSSESHPFYTGQKSNFNNFGTVEKFNKKYNI